MYIPPERGNSKEQVREGHRAIAEKPRNRYGKVIGRLREGYRAMAGKAQRECGKPRRDCGKSTERFQPDSVSLVSRQSDLDNMVAQTGQKRMTKQKHKHKNTKYNGGSRKSDKE